MVVGSWQVHTVDGAEVRLRSGRVGLMRVDVTAPVTGGELVSSAEGTHFTLRMALDRLKTGNFLIQAAARSLVARHDATVLTYSGSGAAAGGGWSVSGRASAGDVDIDLHLDITPCGPDGSPMSEIELVGSANVGEVNLPFPGMGHIEDFSFDVDARLWMRPSV